LIVTNIGKGKTLNQDLKLKIFLSYSHKDNLIPNQNIEAFRRHLAPLKDNGFVEEWYDRFLLAGDKIKEKIDCNIENADIICLFLSAYSLDSFECKAEKRKAIELNKKKNIPVIPIILSKCGLKDYPEFDGLLAIPTDGKPVSEFSDNNEAWYDVYQNLKPVITKEYKIKQLSIKEQFKTDFLVNTEILTQAHPRKEKVTLNDIYISPQLDKLDYSKRTRTTIEADELIDNLLEEEKIIITGDNQSGKTTLCKMLFCELRKLNYIPVYISVNDLVNRGNIESIIENSLHEQYSNFNDNEMEKERIVPIIDDFHQSKDKEKRLKKIISYLLCIIVVDDAFTLNVKDKPLISSFTYFKIKELKPSTRYKLVKKWVSLSDQESDINYKNIDKNVDLINNTLGRNIGKGLLPAYPFFILTTLFTYETYAIPLNQDITSQGHCYQAFIYYYLTQKRGVKNDEIDIYINFLTELASHMFHTKQNELNYQDFCIFMDNYSNKYNLPIDANILLQNLNEIVSKDSLGNYFFKYPCFYYYFVAKSLTEHVDDADVMRNINTILENLHLDENAYIAIFLVHHSKNTHIFEKIEQISSSLFNKYKPATLAKDEMRFFDEQEEKIVKAALPPHDLTPEIERNRRLELEDEFETRYDTDPKEEGVSENSSFLIDFRKTIKTVEVIGCIIRNRAGSLEKERLQDMFKSGMNVHLRMLSWFIESIKSEEGQKEMVDLIIRILIRLDKRKDENQKLSEEERRKIAHIIFWNINFYAISGHIYKICLSLGSDKLIPISNQVCDQIDDPSSFLIKHGIIMRYQKNIQLYRLKKRINEKDFSKIALNTAKMLVVNHCYINLISYRDIHKIGDTLGIPRSQLIGKK
jgi:hypothetical protein